MQDEGLHKCRLLLFEDPALEAQPRHEVAVGVGRNEPVAHDTVQPSGRFRHPHMCAWIDETRQMNVLRSRFGCAMFKGTRDVCTSVVPKGYLSLGGNFGRCVKASPLRVNMLEK